MSIFSDICGLITNYSPVTPVHRPSTVSTVHWSPSAPTTTVTSPTLYTPLLLSWFLQYSQDHLGVFNTISYENTLLQHGYGLDILHKVPSKDLKNLGISTGDIIRLKEACLPWFTGPLTKCKHHNDAKPQDLGQEPPPPKKRLVRYKRWWFTADSNPDGATQFYGGIMKGCNGLKPKGESDGMQAEVWYFCEAHNDWAQVPLGFVAVADDADPF